MFASAIAVLIAGSAATAAAISTPSAHPTSLAFVEPQSLVNGQGAGSVHYQTGEHVNISWSSPYDYTTLSVWEGPLEDGTYMESVIADKWSKDRSHLTWKVSSATNDPRYGFHFELRKGYKPNDCAACVANSPRFAVAIGPATTSSSSATSSVTSTTVSHSKTTTSHSSTTITSSSTISSSTSSATTSSLISSTSSVATVSSTSTSTSTSSASAKLNAADANALSTASATPSYIPDSTNSEHDLGVGLGVGVGAGVPIIIAAYAIGLFLYTRRQRRNQSVQLPSFEDDAQRLNEKEPRSATNSWISKVSRYTTASVATSYHEPFEFQGPDGSRRPGSERLFRKGEQIPGVPARVFRQ